jgi:hypothetical protein
MVQAFCCRAHPWITIILAIKHSPILRATIQECQPCKQRSVIIGGDKMGRAEIRSSFSNSSLAAAIPTPVFATFRLPQISLSLASILVHASTADFPDS